MELLYALLCEKACADGDLMMRLLRDVEDGVIIDAFVVDSSADYVEISRNEAHCAVQREEQPVPAVLIVGTLQNYESVGLCWDALILLSMLSSCDIWLSTYSEEDLANFGELHSLVLQGKCGYVISAGQFTAMVE